MVKFNKPRVRKCFACGKKFIAVEIRGYRLIYCRKCLGVEPIKEVDNGKGTKRKARKSSRSGN